MQETKKVASIITENSAAILKEAMARLLTVKPPQKSQQKRKATKTRKRNSWPLLFRRLFSLAFEAYSSPLMAFRALRY
jgi:hypothetical protein